MIEFATIIVDNIPYSNYLNDRPSIQLIVNQCQCLPIIYDRDIDCDNPHPTIKICIDNCIWELSNISLDTKNKKIYFNGFHCSLITQCYLLEQAYLNSY